jgi:hypothetical protein
MLTGFINITNFLPLKLLTLHIQLFFLRQYKIKYLKLKPTRKHAVPIDSFLSPGDWIGSVLIGYGLCELQYSRRFKLIRGQDFFSLPPL